MQGDGEEAQGEQGLKGARTRGKAAPVNLPWLMNTTYIQVRSSMYNRPNRLVGQQCMFRGASSVRSPSFALTFLACIWCMGKAGCSWPQYALQEAACQHQIPQFLMNLKRECNWRSWMKRGTKDCCAALPTPFLLESS